MPNSFATVRRELERKWPFLRELVPGDRLEVDCVAFWRILLNTFSRGLDHRRDVIERLREQALEDAVTLSHRDASRRLDALRSLRPATPPEQQLLLEQFGEDEETDRAACEVDACDDRRAA